MWVHFQEKENVTRHYEEALMPGDPTTEHFDLSTCNLGTTELELQNRYEKKNGAFPKLASWKSITLFSSSTVNTEM